MKTKIYIVHAIVRLNVQDNYRPEDAVGYVQQALTDGLERQAEGDEVEDLTLYELVDNGGWGL